jgi:hypothetical protein
LKFSDLRRNAFQHACQIPDDIGIPKAEHGYSVFFEPASSGLIVGKLCMLSTVKFNNKTNGRRIKIEDIISDRMLPAEIDTELPIAQLVPNANFDFGEIAPEFARSQRLQPGSVKSDSLHDPPPGELRSPTSPLQGEVRSQCYWSDV